MQSYPTPSGSEFSLDLNEGHINSFCPDDQFSSSSSPHSPLPPESSLFLEHHTHRSLSPVLVPSRNLRTPVSIQNYSLPGTIPPQPDSPNIALFKAMNQIRSDLSVIKSELVNLTTEFRTAIRSLTDTFTKSSANPATEHPTFLEELNSARFPMITNWKEDDKNTKKEIPLKGKVRDCDAPNRALYFLQKVDGTTVTELEAADIREVASGIWESLAQRGMALEKWSSATHEAKVFFERCITPTFPFLRYCSGRWKLQLLCTLNYSSWHSGRIAKLEKKPKTTSEDPSGPQPQAPIVPSKRSGDSSLRSNGKRQRVEKTGGPELQLKGKAPLRQNGAEILANRLNTQTRSWAPETAEVPTGSSPSVSTPLASIPAGSAITTNAPALAATPLAGISSGLPIVDTAAPIPAPAPLGGTTATIPYPLLATSDAPVQPQLLLPSALSPSSVPINKHRQSEGAALLRTTTQASLHRSPPRPRPVAKGNTEPPSTPLPAAAEPIATTPSDPLLHSHPLPPSVSPPPPITSPRALTITVPPLSAHSAIEDTLKAVLSASVWDELAVRTALGDEADKRMYKKKPRDLKDFVVAKWQDIPIKKRTGAKRIDFERFFFHLTLDERNAYETDFKALATAA